MSNETIKTSADKIVEKYFDEICHHPKKGSFTRDLQTVWAEPMAIKLAILEVEACIELMASFGHDYFPITIERYSQILTELKSRIV